MEHYIDHQRYAVSGPHHDWTAANEQSTVDAPDVELHHSAMRRSNLRRLLYPFRDRIQTMITDAWLWCMYPSIAPSLASLHTLILRCDTRSPWTEDPVDLTKAEHLTHVCIQFAHEFPFDSDELLELQVPASWQVERLNLAGVDTQCAIGAINSCQRLKYLTWRSECEISDMPWALDGEPVYPDPFDMRNLQHMNEQVYLEYLALEGDIPIVLMGHVSAPALCILDLDHSGDLGWDSDEYSSWNFVDHPLRNPLLFPVIRQLTIQEHPLGRPVDIVAFLQGHEQLEILEIGFDLSDALVDYLGIMPGLTSLTVSTNHLNSPNYDLAPVERLLQLWGAESTRQRTLSIPQKSMESPEAHALLARFDGILKTIPFIGFDEHRELQKSELWDWNVL